MASKTNLRKFVEIVAVDPDNHPYVDQTAVIQFKLAHVIVLALCHGSIVQITNVHCGA